MERELTAASSTSDVDAFDENSAPLDVGGCLVLTPPRSAVAATEEVVLRASIANAEFVEELEELGPVGMCVVLFLYYCLWSAEFTGPGIQVDGKDDHVPASR